MNKTDKFEKEILKAYESGELVSVKPTKEDMATFKKSAQATSLKDRRVNIRLSSPDLRDIQSRALEEGVPYQTLIASILHKYISGRLVEKPSRLTTRRTDGKNCNPSR
jgi:predicted DNA binding CopG/RHH family protein